MCEFHESTCNGLGDIWWTDNPIYFSSIDYCPLVHIVNSHKLPLQGAGILFFSCCNYSCAHNSFFDGCLVSSSYTAHFKWTSHHVFYLLYIDSSSPVYYPLIRDAHYPGYFRFGFWRNSGSVEKYINCDFVH